MTQEQKEEFVRLFNAPFNSFRNIGKAEKPPADSVYLRNGKPVIKAITLSRLLGWKHDSIIAEIKCWLTGDQSINFFETDYSSVFDYEVTKQGYELLLAEFGISNQTQANNEDAICAAFDVFENIGDMGVSQPEEIALAVEMMEDLMQKYVGHLTIYAALKEFIQDPVKFQHHQRLLNIFHLSLLDGCLFIADRCPLVDYDLLHWHPDSITDIPHDFGTIRPSIMIRLFDSTIDSDIPY